MAAFQVADGTDWLETLVFDGPNARWRLDDYDILAHLKKANDAAVLIAMSTDNGTLVISDPIARRLEINVPWTEINVLQPGPFVFDILFKNKTTGIRTRSVASTLTVIPAITLPEA